MVANPKRRVAVYGGQPSGWKLTLPDRMRLSHYGSERRGGRRSLGRLQRSIASGGVDQVVVLVRWAGHSATSTLRRQCRSQGVPCALLQGSRTDLARLLEGVVAE